MLDIPTLETARLRLRPYRLEDFDAYAAMWADPAVVRFIGGVPFTREASWPRFLRQSGLWLFLGFGSFIIEHKATGVVAGECGFHDLRRAIEPSIEGTMEAGWILAAPMQGQGIAEEAMRAAIGWASTHGTGDRLTCLIDQDHAASQRVAAKLGFVEYARTTYTGKPVILLERPRRAPIGSTAT
ncbi:MAG: GNAT family N-acetyltransferase [Devosia sp.]